MEVKLQSLQGLSAALQQWAETPIGFKLVMCLVMLVATVALRRINGTKLQVPILLADEMPSHRKRVSYFSTSARDLLNKGYAKYGDKVWGYNTLEGVSVVVPPIFVDKLKSNPALSFKAFIDQDMLMEYTHFGGPPDNVMTAIRGNLNSSLPAYVPVLHDLTRRKLSQVVGPLNEWTCIGTMKPVLRIVGTAAARAFHGTAAAQNEDWLDASLGYLEAVMGMLDKIKKYPKYARPFVHWFLPERKAIIAAFASARKIVAETSKQRQRQGGGALDNPPSLFDVLTMGKNEPISYDLDKQTMYQMTLVAVGSSTTFISVLQALNDLVAYPEYIPILRQEIEAVPRDENEKFSKESLVKMAKLDSFMKESARVNGSTLSTFQRAATADVRLPDGTLIPKGTWIETATSCIYNDEKNYENPQKFDGLRYYNYRQRPGEESRHQYVSTGVTDLNFGYGRHACPGRFTSEVIIKLLLAEILLTYDIKLEGKSRPQNKETGLIVEPDMEAKLLFKTRIK